MRNLFYRFLGDSPSRVVIKLLVLSFVVGLVMSTIGWSPRDFYNGVLRFFSRIWELGFDTLLNSLEYLVFGAAIVVPVFLLIRLLGMRSR